MTVTHLLWLLLHVYHLDLIQVSTSLSKVPCGDISGNVCKKGTFQYFQ